MRRVLPFLLLIVVVAVAAVVAARPGEPPVLRFDGSVPDDLRELAKGTWNEFTLVHEGRLNCIAPVTLHAAWELDDRGRYLPDTATVILRVPGTPALLRATLVHEFAHHVEFTCPEQEDLRDAFLTAQGFAPGSDWFRGESWDTIPSEQYAEATTEIVLGRRPHHGNIRLTPEAIAVVREWASGA